MSFFAEYPVRGTGSGGVTSLNGQTGALTLVAGANITITPGAGTLTIASTGGGGANTALSNLAAVAINTSLLPGVDNSINLGSATKTFASGFIRSLQSATFGVESISPENFVLNDGNGAAWPSLSFGNEELIILPKNPGLPRTLKWTDEAGALGIGLRSPSGLSQDYIYTFPSNYGTAGYSLQTDGLGGLSWGTSSSSSGIAGSVQFSDGASGFDSDATDFFWDDTNKTLVLGPSPGPALFGLVIQRSDTDAANQSGGIYSRHDNFLTANNPFLSSAGSFDAHFQADASVSSSGGAAVLFNAFRDQSSDMGTLSFLVGAFGGATQSTVDPAATTNLVSGILSQVNVNAGTATNVADFYGLAGNLTGGTIVNQFGIYIEPSNVGSKHNWLSGDLLVGGSSFSAPTVTLQVNGDFSASKTVTDTGVAAATVTASSDTTVSGSNTTLGINGVASGTVQTGAINDKVIGGMNFAVTRGDGTDQGNLSAMTGANVLMFHNSDAAGSTDNVFGFSTLFFSTGGTATNLYDFYSQRVPSGSGVVTNHYGVYIANDSATPVKNWLSGVTQMGGSSFSPAASTILDLQSTTGALLVPRMSTADKTALTAAEGMIVYDTDLVEIEGYMGGTWTALGGGGGGGANTALSNLASTAVNTDIIPGSDNTINLGSAALTWALAYIQILRDSTDNPVLSVNTRELMNSSGTPSIDFSSTSQVLFYRDIVFNQPGNVQTIDTGLADTDSIEVKSGNASSGFNSGQAFFRSGNGDASADAYFGSGIASVGNSGSARILSNSAAGNSGDIVLSIGTAGGTRGSITLQDGTEGIAGAIWTSTDTTGKGAWAGPGASGSFTTVDLKTVTVVNGIITSIV